MVYFEATALQPPGKDAAPIVAGFDQLRCVLPRKCLDGENETIKFCKGYRPCRQSGDGTCVHCRAAAAYLSQARRSPSSPNRARRVACAASSRHS